MPSRDDIAWFKQHFGASIARAVAGSPLTVDLVVAIACQETGYVWAKLRHEVASVDEVLALCVGDTLDASAGRSAFPRSKASLVLHPRGPQMFAIARAALEAVAKHNATYAAVARNPAKFCRGYGIFQYDLQFFLKDAGWFLDRRWTNFDACLDKCVAELHAALARFGWQGRAALSDTELAHVAIRYNRGGFTPSRGLRQGHFDGTRYYGEAIAAYLALARSVPTTAQPPAAPEAVPAPTPEPEPAPSLAPQPAPPATPGGSMFPSIFGPLAEIFGKVIDKAIPDATKAAEAKAEIAAELMRNNAALTQAARDTIVAEAQGESWMQRNWRPSLMFVIMAMMVWAGVLVPLLSALTGRDFAKLLAWYTVPQEMWSLLQLGVGGYLVGRTGEKMIDTWVATKTPANSGGAIGGAK